MSSMPVFENPCGAYSRYEMTKGIPLDRLETICAAEKDGRVVVMPCKVGDKIYVIGGIKHETYMEIDSDISEEETYAFLIGDDARVLIKSDAWDGSICYADELGKITGSPFWEGYYLTRAEAEKALGKEQGHD